MIHHNTPGRASVISSLVAALIFFLFTKISVITDFIVALPGVASVAHLPSFLALAVVFGVPIGLDFALKNEF
jgi:hypothetical protein